MTKHVATEFRAGLMGPGHVQKLNNPQVAVPDGDKGDVTVSGGGAVWVLSATAKGKLVGIAADRAALAAMSGAVYQSVDLMEAGRKGRFQWDNSNLSAMVTLDTQQGIYVPPASAPTGANGAWVRVYDRVPSVRAFGAKLDGSTNDSVAVQASLDVLGKAVIPYTLTGLVANNITLGTAQEIAAERKTIWKTTAAASWAVRVTAYMSELGTALNNYARIKHIVFDLAASPTTVAAILMGTATRVVYGLRVFDVDFKNCGAAYLEETHASNYVVDVQLTDCICTLTRARQVYSKRSRGFFTFRDFKIDHTANTAQVTWEGARFEDLIGLELEKFDVVGPTAGVPTQTYQAGSIGLVINGSGAGQASVWLTRVLIDNTRGPGMSLSNLFNVFSTSLCLFQNFGTLLTMNSVTKSMFSDTKLVGGKALPGAAAGAHGLSMVSCELVTFNGLEVEDCTGSGVVQVSCTDCKIIGGYSNNNTGYGYIEDTAATRNLRSGVSARGNGAGSLLQIGAQSATVNWWSAGGNFLPSNVGAITVP